MPQATSIKPRLRKPCASLTHGGKPCNHSATTQTASGSVAQKEKSQSIKQQRKANDAAIRQYLAGVVPSKPHCGSCAIPGHRVGEVKLVSHVTNYSLDWDCIGYWHVNVCLSLPAFHPYAVAESPIKCFAALNRVPRCHRRLTEGLTLAEIESRHPELALLLIQKQHLKPSSRS